MKRFVVLAFILAASTVTQTTYAGISIEPFVSISSKKAIKPNKAGSTTADETVTQRTTYGVRGSLSFWRLMKFQLSVGQNKLDTTTKTSEAVDEFDEIDFEKDLNMDTSQQDADVKMSETQRKASAAFVLDPSFWIFIMRMKAGVQATQRLMTLQQGDSPEESYTSPITYKPVASVGLGVRLGRTMYAMAEYGAFFYKFPETEPFEREVTISYGISL
ncbi:MAG: hypothetical protein AB7T49_10075 [Oligoflexales bacterium]